jgi:hypothetical protein
MSAPSTDNREPSRRLQPPVPAELLLKAYMFCGALTGGIVGGAAMFGEHSLFELNRIIAIPALDANAWMRPTWFGLVGAICIACAFGAFCGPLMRVFYVIWPPSKNPFPAAIVCSSLGGSLCLVLVVLAHPELTFDDDHFRGLLATASTMALGAVFGFVFTLLVVKIESILPSVLLRFGMLQSPTDVHRHG